ncbi:MAG: DUF2905 domain-containing protein [Candidatus Omnitrophica bacterium]|nr:DUF2905 domain-containing protein [Candidatus Omnitrophota bacterium]
MPSLGKMLVIFGVVLIMTGFLFQFFGRIPGFGRLPGDFYVKRGSFSFYFPLTTSLLVSLLLSLILSFFWKR